MFILYSVLVLCTVAVVGVAFAIYRLVRRHLRHAHPEAHVSAPRLGPVPVRPRGPQLVRAANVRPGEQKG